MLLTASFFMPLSIVIVSSLSRVFVISSKVHQRLLEFYNQLNNKILLSDIKFDPNSNDLTKALYLALGNQIPETLQLSSAKTKESVALMQIVEKSPPKRKDKKEKDSNDLGEDLGGTACLLH